MGRNAKPREDSSVLLSSRDMLRFLRQPLPLHLARSFCWYRYHDVCVRRRSKKDFNATGHLGYTRHDNWMIFRGRLEKLRVSTGSRSSSEKLCGCSAHTHEGKDHALNEQAHSHCRGNVITFPGSDLPMYLIGR